MSHTQKAVTRGAILVGGFLAVFALVQLFNREPLVRVVPAGGGAGTAAPVVEGSGMTPEREEPGPKPEDVVVPLIGDWRPDVGDGSGGGVADRLLGNTVYRFEQAGAGDVRQTIWVGKKGGMPETFRLEEQDGGRLGLRGSRGQMRWFEPDERGERLTMVLSDAAGGRSELALVRLD